MRNWRRCTSLNGIMLGAVLCASGVVSAQGSRLTQFGKPNRNFGIDNGPVRLQCSPAFKQQRPALPSTTVEGLADQVSEIRIFLTPERNVVVSEIAIAGKTRL